jgi:hypothetical protein
MNEKLQEFVHSRGVAVRVDREAGIIHGVKILGLTSRNGRSYLPEALSTAAGLYEEAKVNVNHPKGAPTGPRDYQDRIGTIRHVALRPGEGLFADFHFNPKHALAEQLIWDAEHAPENVGFSHNVEARTTRRGEQVVVEGITKVQSVDLVADPATTRGLYEGSAGDIKGDSPIFAGTKIGTVPWAAVSLEDLRQQRPDLIEALLGQQAHEANRLREEVGRLEGIAAVQQKRSTARRLLAEFKLPDPEASDTYAQAVVGGSFLESLLAAPNDGAMRQLIEERVRLLRATAASGDGFAPTSRPRSREQAEVYGAAPADVKGFIAAIT